MGDAKRNVIFATCVSLGLMVGHNVLRLLGKPQSTTFIEDIALFGLTSYVLIVILTFGPKLHRRSEQVKAGLSSP